MESIVFFFVHYGVLALGLLVALTGRFTSQLGLWSATAFTGSVAAFVFVWGQWPLVGSYHARLLPLVVSVIVVVASLVRATGAGLTRLNRRMAANTGSVVLLIMTGFVIAGLAAAVAGRQYPEPVADLQFPLRGGRYYVASGGSTRIINNHLRSKPTAQDYALDINRLGAAGGVSGNVFSTDNRSHHIFGVPVHAPCHGTVVEGRDGVADNVGSGMTVEPGQGRGNFLIIDCGDIRVTLMHLQSGSLQVAPGQVVGAGAVLGRVGNSGFSQEPHLHLHAATATADGDMAGIPMRFDGRTYARNDVIDAP